MPKRLVITTLIIAALPTGAIAQFTDPNSGPQPGTTDVRPAMPTSPREQPRIGRRPAPAPTRPFEPSPIPSSPSPLGPNWRELHVPGAPRTIPVPSSWGYPNSTTQVWLTDLLPVDPRWFWSGQAGWNSFAISNARGTYIPGVDTRAPGFWFFPGGNTLVARPVDFYDFIRYSGLGPYWSWREANGLPAEPPVLNLRPDGSVEVRYVPANWYDYSDESRLLADPQYPLPSAAINQLAPQPAQAAPQPPSLLDQADARFADRRYADAATLYQQHLAAEPNDGWAMRALAMCQWLSRTPDDALATLLRAYTVTPELAAEPFPIDGFPRGRRQLSDELGRATVKAERDRTPQAWLMVAVLLQSSGQRPGALKMVDRAAAAGLDPIISDKFRTALGKQP